MDKIVSQSVGMFDTNLEICDSSTPASWQNGGGFSVSNVAKIIDLGSNALFTGNLVVDVDGFASGAIATDSQFNVILQGSRSATFSSGIEELSVLRLVGPVSAKSKYAAYSGDSKAETGRFIQPFRNERNSNYFRYLRLFGCGSATGATLAASAYLTK